MDQLLKAGRVWVVDADLKAYFDTIPQEPLMRLVEEQIADSRVLELIGKMLKQGVMETAKEWQPTEKGTPQGAVISPLLANLYLNPLDHLMVGSGKEMVRYADDFVILCESQAEAEEVLEQLPPMDPCSRTGAASGQNAHCGRESKRRIRFSECCLSSGAIAGRGRRAWANSGKRYVKRRPVERPATAEPDHHRREPHVAGLVQLLPT